MRNTRQMRCREVVITKHQKPNRIKIEEEGKEHNMGLEIGGEIEKVNGKNLTYNDFVEKYLSKNQPVLLTGLMDDWLACRDWVTLHGNPNLHFFSTKFGKSRVQVADCGTREFTDQKRVEMSVSDFVNDWLDTSAGPAQPLLYLKDWHFVKEYPDYIAYTTPLFFCDDWLNLYLDHHHRLHQDSDIYQENNELSSSDYRFVYMGKKGSWTPLHADVFRSYSWSANVCGKKRWLLLSPSQSHLVFDKSMKNSVYNILDDVSDRNIPGFEKAIWLECTQERNEIVFVPSGWFHQVHNLEDTISINHNWFNGYNLAWVWDLLLKDYNEAKEYIEDIKDICDNFEDLCQRNLAANTGMNFADFFIFLTRFSLATMYQLEHSLLWIRIHSDRNSSLLVHNLVLNLVVIRKIALSMKSISSTDGNNGFCLDLRDTLDDPSFLEMSVDLGRTYGMIHRQQNWASNANNSLANFGDHSICTPQELVKFVDYAIANLSSNCCEGTILLRELHDALSLDQS